MSRRWYSLLTTLTPVGDLGGFHERRRAGHVDDLHTCPYGFNEIHSDYEPTTKIFRFNNRSFWCCFLLLIPIVIPILIYFRDSDFTKRIFIAFFAVVLIILLVCFSLVVHTRARKLVADRRNNAADIPPNLQMANAEISSASQLHPAAYCQCQMTPRPFSRPSNAADTAGLTHLSVNSEPVIGATANRDNLHLSLTSVKDFPPPYHVAVNLPSPNSVETPPPPYEHAV